MIFIAKDIRAERVNLLMNDYASGLPSPLSFIGLADAIVRDLGLTPWSARVIPVLHHVCASVGRTKPEMERKHGAFMPIETMEDLVGTVDLSLVLDIPQCESASDIAGSLMRRRVAGGIIQNERIEVDAVAKDGSAFRHLRRGYAMLAPNENESDKCMTSNGDQSGFAHILEILFPDERLPGSGWFVPVAAGYHLLEDPDRVPERIRRRDSTVPHVFAEPLLGMAELVSIRNRRLTDRTGEHFTALFWSWHVDGDRIVGHQAYLSNSIQKEENIAHG
ncbi:MAG: hypothetical protein OXC68_09515 [Aestuariivita sp.]|nr:hypothetical protein [Aestuariivita sp.]